MRPSLRALALAALAVAIVLVLVAMALVAPQASCAQQAAPVVPNPGARDMF